DLTFNPASNVKVATAYAILKSHGPDYRFQTAVYTDGTIDYQNARLEGNLYISGRDPVFQSQNAVMIADALNKLGIREVNGNLVVTGKFTINQSNSPQTSARILLSTLDPAKRSASATRAWLEYLQTSGMAIQGIYSPGVSIFGETYVGIIPENAKLLFVHESIPLKEIVKLMMCYSNNFIAERLGNELGGAYMVASIVQRDIGVSYQEFYLQTSSGLGINRATPRAMMKLLRVFLKELESYGMTLADVMPVAGIDPGTLQNRFNDIYSIGSLVGKTGTLGNTDGGVSSLSGEMQTRNGGKLLFVIFNQRGSVHRFRNFQDSYIKQIQNEFGGPVTFAYSPMNSQKLAQSRIIFSNTVKN
ncbi:MAG: D-alanyl-D-alanine carboxypeptidase, partial [Pyrinomonadaceae bacterium]